MSNRVIVAMSGGVDSTVAALLLHQSGWEVLGVSLRLYCSTDERHGCCTEKDFEDARENARRIGISHRVVNAHDVFRKRVVANFIDEYSKGRTPIPCTHCNTEIKFGFLRDYATAHGYPYIATGHYARIVSSDDGARVELRKGIDPIKDQSFFLFELSEKELRHTLFPIGQFTKDEIRHLAEEASLSVAQKKDSYDLCFVTDSTYRSFLATQSAADRPGRIEDAQGTLLGHHDGVSGFTIGQRRNLNLAVHSSRKLYVTSIHPKSATVRVGSVDALMKRTLSASGAVLHAPLRRETLYAAKIRSTAPAAECRVTHCSSEASTFSLEFSTPQRAITPGQTVVVYDGDRVVAGGWIDGEEVQEHSL